MAIDTRAAYTREAIEFTKTWPSATVAVATSDSMVPIITENVQVSNDQRAIVERRTEGGATAPTIIRTRVDGPAQIVATYEGLEFLLTAALGLEANRLDGVLMPEELVPGTVYRHLIEVDDRLDAVAWQAGEGFIAGLSPIGDGLIAGQQKMRRGTFSVDKGDFVWDTRSAMVGSLAFQATPQGVLFQAEILGYDIDYTSATNAGLAALICESNQLVFNDSTLELRSASDTSFTGNLLVDSSEFNGVRFVLNNGLRAISTRDVSPNIAEPRRQLAPVLSGSLALPRTSNTTLIEAARNNTELTARLSFVGEVIGATAFSFTMIFWFPSLFLTGVDTPVISATQNSETFAFVAAVPDSMPTDFPTSVTTGMLLIELINTVSEHPLL